MLPLSGYDQTWGQGAGLQLWTEGNQLRKQVVTDQFYIQIFNTSSILSSLFVKGQHCVYQARERKMPFFSLSSRVLQTLAL